MPCLCDRARLAIQSAQLLSLCCNAICCSAMVAVESHLGNIQEYTVTGRMHGSMVAAVNSGKTADFCMHRITTDCKQLYKDPGMASSLPI